MTTRRGLGLAQAVLVAMSLALAGCSVPGPDGPAETFNLDFSMPQGAEVHGAVIFLVDGLNAEVFAEMLAAGELPAMKKYFVERGLYCPAAVANIPSVTLANETSLVTGLLPGHHGITGINWFDRNRLLWRNYETIAQKNTLDGDYTARNLYEHFPDRTTFSIFFQAHRGATKFIENSMSAAPLFGFGWYEYVDRLTLFRFGIVADVARERREWPAVTIAYLLAPDFRAYDFGVGSPQYREAIRHTDRQLGRVLADMEGAGLLEKIHVALVSDHSLMDVEKHFPLEQFLRTKVGLNIARRRLWEQTRFEVRLDYYKRYDCVLYGSGDRYWAICLRKPLRDGTGRVTGGARWPVRPNAKDLRNYPVKAGPHQGEVDLLKLLAEQEAIDAIAYAVGPNRVRVRRARGEVEFRQDGGRGGKISYRVVSGKDPFGWDKALSADVRSGRPLAPREWLTRTAGTQFPDLPPQIIAYFRARRAGDIAVFAAPGWDFSNKNRAGHGGLRPGDMLVPMLLAGPGVAKGRLAPARTVDLLPTLLRLLGRDVPPGLDGKCLLDER